MKGVLKVQFKSEDLMNDYLISMTVPSGSAKTFSWQIYSTRALRFWKTAPLGRM